MLNLTSLFLQQIKTGDLVIDNVNIDVTSNKVIVTCSGRTQDAPIEVNPPSVVSQNQSPEITPTTPETRRFIGNFLDRLNNNPERYPQPSKNLKPDMRTMITYAELCGSHENKWHAKRSLERILRDERFATPESVAQEWIRRCKPKNGDIPQEAKNLESMFLMEDN